VALVGSLLPSQEQAIEIYSQLAELNKNIHILKLKTLITDTLINGHLQYTKGNLIPRIVSIIFQQLYLLSEYS
jgi:hypothetical protein